MDLVVPVVLDRRVRLCQVDILILLLLVLVDQGKVRLIGCLLGSEYCPIEVVVGEVL